jgi:O-succinylbenzoate synthase
MAMYRASAGCTDTDNNAADISSALVSPRNSASAINVCQGAPPSMRAFINNGNLTIAWPTSATGFNLETASAVNQNPWNVVSVAPTVVGSENQVTVLINGTAFFRLKK